VEAAAVSGLMKVQALVLPHVVDLLGQIAPEHFWDALYQGDAAGLVEQARMAEQHRSRLEQKYEWSADATKVRAEQAYRAVLDVLGGIPGAERRM
jgi:hypothetical protein